MREIKNKLRTLKAALENDEILTHPQRIALIDEIILDLDDAELQWKDDTDGSHG